MRGRSQAGFTFTDLMVVLAIVALLGAMVPAMSAGFRERGDRIKCASNLRCIGQMMKMYDNDFKTYPRGPYNASMPTQAGFSANGWNVSPPPFGRVNDVNVAMFLLVKVQELSPDVFICPSTPDEKMIVNNSIQNYSAFGPDDKCLSYSIANPYPMGNNRIGLEGAAREKGYKWTTDQRGAEKAIAADRNDGSGDLSVTGASPAKQQRALNSGNHDRDGQNVLYDDSHVDWVTTAWAGHERDNIFTRARMTTPPTDAGYLIQMNPPQSDPAGGTDPAYDMDTILLPVFAARPGSAGSILGSGPMVLVIAVLAIGAAIGGVILLRKKKAPVPVAAEVGVAPAAGGPTPPPLNIPLPPPSAPVAEWFYLKDNKPVGPVTLEQLRSMRQSGQLPAGQLVWCERMGQWAPMETVHIG